MQPGRVDMELSQRLGWVAFTAFLIVIPATARAQGGPPLITDDPDTPGPGYWEINVSTSFEKSRTAHRSEVPRIDMNYGVGEHIQLKLEVPWVGAHAPDEPAQRAVGDAVAGVKWRFLGQEGQRLSWSIYPQLEFNLGHGAVDKGLVEEGNVYVLPTELTVEVAHLEMNVEVGYRIVHAADNEWFWGVSTEGHVVPRLELLAEIHGERRGSDPTELIFNIGARPKITRQLLLLLAAGRAFRGVPEERPQLLLFAGIQANLPGLYDFEHRRPRTR